MAEYIHGYSSREAERLSDQASTLEELLHHDSFFKNGSLALEAGCGTGAQTQIISSKNPETKFISVDISENSMHQAKKTIDKLGISNVTFQREDIYQLSFQDETFDAVFICFVLEHLKDPIKVLQEIKRVLKPGGNLMVIEGDHGSTYFYPESKYAQAAVQCQVELMKKAGGNANIGRTLYPLLHRCGYKAVSVSPRTVYVDGSKPELIEGFTKNTFSAMIEGIESQVSENELMDLKNFKQGVADLYNTANEYGVFCYTFFKAFAIKN